MSGAYIRLSNVSLQLPTFIQHQASGDSWAKTLIGAAVDRPERRLKTILESIDLAVEEGDRVALIGRNGAGKTTLLHILTGCYLPTRGEVQVSGTRQALLNVSLGFNPEATLRENIFLRGAAMGLPMDVIREALEEILEFAELAHVAGQRLATLSAGQRMRLGFAISTSVQPDIMLLDEWLGTGDAEFMQRARDRMQSRVAGSRIMVLASHSTDLLRRVCNRGIVVDAGRIVFDDSIGQALQYYQEMVKPGVNPPAGGKPAAATGAAFARRQLRHADGYGIAFEAPVHCLYENRTADQYGFLVEIERDSLASALSTLASRLSVLGFAPSGYGGAGTPTVFEFAAPDGATARVTLKAYGPKEAREAPGAIGRLHLALAGRTP